MSDAKPENAADRKVRIEKLEAALRALDDMIFHDPQIIERAGEMRSVIREALDA